MSNLARLCPSASLSAPLKIASDARAGWGPNIKTWNDPDHKTEAVLVRQKQRSNGSTWNATATATEPANYP